MHEVKVNKPRCENDGIMPYYFQLVKLTVIKTILFDGERARQNKLEKKHCSK